MAVPSKVCTKVHTDGNDYYVPSKVCTKVHTDGNDYYVPSKAYMNRHISLLDIEDIS